MVLNLKPSQQSSLETQVEELKQTPDHRLTPFDVRIRRLLVQIYELMEDLQIQNRDLNNRIESMSTEINGIIQNLNTIQQRTIGLQ